MFACGALHASIVALHFTWIPRPHYRGLGIVFPEPFQAWSWKDIEFRNHISNSDRSTPSTPTQSSTQGSGAGALVWKLPARAGMHKSEVAPAPVAVTAEASLSVAAAPAALTPAPFVPADEAPADGTFEQEMRAWAVQVKRTCNLSELQRRKWQRKHAESCV